MLAEQALRALPLSQPGARTGYRARVVYGCLGAVTDDDLGLPNVKAAAECLAAWIKQDSKMPSYFWRDATIRASRSGDIHVKLVLQLSPECLGGTQSQLAALETWPEWAAEQAPFVQHLQRGIARLTGISCQIALGASRPAKTA